MERLAISNHPAATAFGDERTATECSASFYALAGPEAVDRRQQAIHVADVDAADAGDDVALLDAGGVGRRTTLRRRSLRHRQARPG